MVANKGRVPMLVAAVVLTGVMAVTAAGSSAAKFSRNPQVMATLDGQHPLGAEAGAPVPGTGRGCRGVRCFGGGVARGGGAGVPRRLFRRGGHLPPPSPRLRRQHRPTRAGRRRRYRGHHPRPLIVGSRPLRLRRASRWAIPGAEQNRKEAVLRGTT